jgi:hypothetical protein
MLRYNTYDRPLCIPHTDGASIEEQVSPPVLQWRRSLPRGKGVPAHTSMAFNLAQGKAQIASFSPGSIPDTWCVLPLP